MMSSTALTGHDTKYLTRVIGSQLSKCLKDLVLVLPEDPFQWISDWLRKFSDNKQYFVEKRKFACEMIDMRQQMSKENRARRRKQKCLQTERNNMMSKLKGGYITLEQESSVDFHLSGLIIPGQGRGLSTGDGVEKEATTGAGISQHSQFSLPAPSPTDSITSDMSTVSSRRRRKLRKTTIGPEGEIIDAYDNGSMEMKTMGGLKYRRGSSGAISVIDENGVEYILGKNGQLIVKSSNVVESHRKSLNRAQVQALFTLGSLKDGANISLPDNQSDYSEVEVRSVGGTQYQRGADGTISVPDERRVEYDSGPNYGHSLGGQHRDAQSKRLASTYADGRPNHGHSLGGQNPDAQSKRLASVYADGRATWGVNSRLALVCVHPVLGVMEPRPPLIYSETPEWWDRQGYLPQTTYDHEVYSRENNDALRDWDQMEHMTYKEFVQEGPWLTQGLLVNMQDSYVDMVKMPTVSHKSKEGGFPPDQKGKKGIKKKTSDPNTSSKQFEKTKKNTKR